MSIAFRLVAVVVLLAGGGVTGAQERKPNLVVVLADELGYGDLGSFGQKMMSTPRLDRMAQEGMRFTQFYAGSSVCAPSRCTLLTGKHTGRTTIRGDSSTMPAALSANDANVAAMLKQAGYATACVGLWGVGQPDSPKNPNEVGFDHFFGAIDATEARKPYPKSLIRDGAPAPLKNTETNRVEYAPDVMVDDALRFVRENQKRPFFLLLSLPRPRGEVPIDTSAAAKDWPAAEKAYASYVAGLDRDAGKILDLLRELKIDSNTLVLFTAATGPSADDGHRPEFFQSTGRFRGGRGEPYEGSIRMPTIAWWPGTVKAGSEDFLQWSAADLMATAAELSGATPPAGLDSDSLVPALRGAAGEDRWRRRGTLYWESYLGRGWQVTRFGKWKAIRSPLLTGEVLLFDMSNDPAEKHNYALRRPDLARHANNLLNKRHEPDPRWKVE